MTVWHLTAFPVSPIHVGDGAVWSLHEFTLENGCLYRFAPWRVLDAMSKRQRDAFIRFLDSAGFKRAQRALRSAVRPEHIVERIALGPEAAEELRRALDDPGRGGEVHGFIRSGGRPYLPGSSIKGAIRTALVSAWSTEKSAAVERKLRSPRYDERDTSRKSDLLQKIVLDAEQDRTEQDPFRFVAVADAPLPDEATRIDRVFNWRPGRKTDIQMHFERLLTVREDRRSAFSVEIRIDEQGCAAAMSRGRDKAPRRMFTAKELWNAINAFSWNRLRAELDGPAFFARESGTRRFLEEVLRHPAVAFDDAGPPPDGPWLLLRVGRFTHFESKSVEGFRQGWNAQRKEPMDEGTTRAVVELEGALIPFGWLLLYRGDASELPEDFPPGLPPGGRGPRGPDTPPRPEKRPHLDGEPVEIVGRDKETVAVRTPAGDTEWVRRDELEWK